MKIKNFSIKSFLPYFTSILIIPGCTRDSSEDSVEKEPVEYSNSFESVKEEIVDKHNSFSISSDSTGFVEIRMSENGVKYCILGRLIEEGIDSLTYSIVPGVSYLIALERSRRINQNFFIYKAHSSIEKELEGMKIFLTYADTSVSYNTSFSIEKDLDSLFSGIQCDSLSVFFDFTATQHPKLKFDTITYDHYFSGLITQRVVSFDTLRITSDEEKITLHNFYEKSDYLKNRRKIFRKFDNK